MRRTTLCVAMICMALLIPGAGEAVNVETIGTCVVLGPELPLTARYCYTSTGMQSTFHYRILGQNQIWSAGACNQFSCVVAASFFGSTPRGTLSNGPCPCYGYLNFHDNQPANDGGIISIVPI